MPTTVNGIGTALVKASKVRKDTGQRQYDAVEAFVILGLTFFPYKALHVISESGSEAYGLQYQSMPLKMRKEIVTLAFLRNWGSMLVLLGILFSAFSGFALATMERAVAKDDEIFLASFLGATVIGLGLRVVHHFVSREHEWIKDTIGPTEFGFADPFFFEDQLAQELLSNIEKQEGGDALRVAEREIAQGNAAKALFLVRLCQNVGTRGSVQSLYDRIRALKS